MALLRNRELGQILFDQEAGDDGEEDDFLGQWTRRRRRPPKDPERFPKVPSPEGTKLMRSGAFGANNYDLRTKRQLGSRMLDRELGLGDREQRKRNSDIIRQV